MQLKHRQLEMFLMKSGRESVNVRKGTRIIITQKAHNFNKDTRKEH